MIFCLCSWYIQSPECKKKDFVFNFNPCTYFYNKLYHDVPHRLLAKKQSLSRNQVHLFI
uniref:Uncharacterized protein n=1 Tax=Glossina morsitans morsitans TaxID=37546 RepID=A0ABK9NG70_GLOMM